MLLLLWRYAVACGFGVNTGGSFRSSNNTQAAQGAHPTPTISPPIQQCFQPRSTHTRHASVHSGNFAELIGCFERLSVHLSAYTFRTYREAQPTPLERSQWITIIRRILDIESIDICEALASEIVNQGMAIGKWYRVVVFKDTDQTNTDKKRGDNAPEESDSYCLLHETTTEEGYEGRFRFAKGWGSFAVRLSRSRPRLSPPLLSTRERPTMPIYSSSLDPVFISTLLSSGSPSRLESRHTLLDSLTGVDFASESLSSSRRTRLSRQPPLIHFSAPHPRSDHKSLQQAAYLFSTIPFSKSLLIAGRHRRSFTVDTWHDSGPSDTLSECFVKAINVMDVSSDSGNTSPSSDVAFEDDDEGDFESQSELGNSSQEQSTLGNSASSSGKKSRYHKTDAAHDDTQPFWDAAVAVWEWQNDYDERIRRHDRGITDGVFIQFHGKGLKTCAEDDIFLSAGFGLRPDSREWYLDQMNQLRTPFHKLFAALQESFTSLTSSSSLSSSSASSSHPQPIQPAPRPSRISYPPSSPTCPLRATHNLLGRLVNGVPKDQVCFTLAPSHLSPSVDDGSGVRTNLKARRGYFIHAEQAPWVRSNERQAYERWREAIVKAFD